MIAVRVRCQILVGGTTGFAVSVPGRPRSGRVHQRRDAVVCTTPHLCCERGAAAQRGTAHAGRSAHDRHRSWSLLRRPGRRGEPCPNPSRCNRRRSHRVTHLRVEACATPGATTRTEPPPDPPPSSPSRPHAHSPRPHRAHRRRQHPPHPSHRRKGGDATDQLNCGQLCCPPLGSSVGHGWAVLLSATGQIPLAIDSSSPRVRGRDRGAFSWRGDLRFIPACAGKGSRPAGA